LKPAESFAGIARDLVEWFLMSAGAGCPNTRLLNSYTTVITRWVERDGFLGKVSPQGLVEVDWKIVTVASGYVKIRPYLDAGVRNKVEGWIQKLYDVSTGRQAFNDNDEGDRSIPNNHFIWHNTAQLYAAIALGSDGKVEQHMKVITDHMQKYITPAGVIQSERRCDKSLHYHYFYMEASLGALAGYKYYKGSLPSAWGSLAGRVAQVISNINNLKLGADRISKEFGYPGNLQRCAPSKMDRPKPLFVTRINGIYKTVTAAKGALAPCDADSSYYGRFRYMPNMYPGGPKPPLGQVCCAL